MNFELEMPKKGKPSPRAISSIARSLLTAALLVAALLALPRPAAAQGTTGTISGTVTDASGATLAGATVTAREVDTNAIHTATTSPIGTYTIPQLAPGVYSVKITQGGFKTMERNEVTLQIDQVAVVDAQLTIGGTEENVEVTTAPPVIQTEDSSVGQVIDSVAIQNTPLNGRLSVMGLIALAPGVQGVGAQDQLATRGLTFAAGTGSRNAYGGLGVTLDGVVNKEITLQRGEPEVPSLDALSQFKVLSAGAPAEFNEPSQVIVVSASGTNKFHGELLEYNRSKGTSAKQYFAGSKARPPYERNEFGGNFAGPIVIPHLYDGKDRTFFFFAYEGFRLDQSSSANTKQPTQAMRGGDFSALATPIIDPATGQPFSGNVIPSSRLNSVSTTLMTKLMPLPTTSGLGTNTFELIPYTSTADRISLHMDHRLGPNDQIRGTLLRALYGPDPTVGTDSLQGGKSGDGEKNTNIILGWTHTFSPTMLLDTTGSFFHLPIYRAPQNINTKWESIIPGLATQYIEGAPHLSFNGEFTSTGESGSHDLEQAGQINTALTKILSRHTIKAGFGYVYDNHFNVAAQTNGFEHGDFTFNGKYSGNPFADFLLGLPNTAAQGSPGSFVTRNISSQWAAYIQDDWKVASKLTLNLGLRYDLQWFQPGPYNNASLWVPSVGKVVVFGNSYPASTIASSQALLNQYNLLTLSSQANLPNNVFSFLGRPDKNFAPRLGFAYEFFPNTVLRGAAGIYFNLLPASYVGSVFGSVPFLDYSTYTNTSYSTAFTMSNPFSASTSGHGGNPSVNAEHSLETPYTEEYNLAIEHQFPHAVEVRVGYVGQHNLKQNNSNGNGNTTPDLNMPDPPVLTESVQAQRLIQPLSSISLNIDPIFHSTMNSLQVGVHKQYTHGLALGAEYQWVRVLGTENINDPSGKYPNDSYGPIAGVTPQVLQINYSYELPFGRGQTLFGNAGGLADTLIHGWQFSGVVNAQTGQPFFVNFDASGSTTYPGLVSGRADRVAGVALYPSKKTRAEWFNPAAFSCPTVTGTTLCGANYGSSGYDMLRGPAFQDWDMSLQKNTRWSEHYNVQLRADVFNVFNHPNLGTPNSDITSSGAGTITSTSGTPSYEARTMEFAVKFTF
jgi:Carboxypeptidase regulatory-like domain/TonB dependent receptor